MENIIEAEGLVKRYGGTRALDGVDLVVPRGSVVGVLGPNGAGKTTAVRVLATLLRADAGTARVAGFDVVKDAGRVRERIGLTGQYASVDEELTGRENLIMIGRLLDLGRRESRERADTLLERFALASAAGRAARTYSGGMRRRLDLAASLLGRPEVVFLDEPTTGLDPRARGQVWETVRGLVSDGASVLLTTQYLDEADALADSIVVFDHGKVIATGTAEELKVKTGGQTLAVRATVTGFEEELARIVGEVTGHRADVDRDSGAVTAPVDDPALLSAVVRRLDEAGIVAAELTLRLPSLDEVFLTLTGRSAA
ncbi:ATP-binding cassette domain-containing protein [Actinocorallia longicatena]|uniref:Daunorubicin resistance protein DrrA family ABC transporter ATP-binding protein n=1 Tax=Actinocorallia longicatena TaxID=111803 RepID=A0ABP6QEN0_9ACTN